MARKSPEASLQIRCVAWFREAFPELILIHVNNNASSRGAAFTLKKKGVLAGFPDLALFQPRGEFCGLMIELKTPRGSVRPEQKEIHQKLIQAGYQVEVIRTFEAFQAAVVLYLS